MKHVDSDYFLFILGKDICSQKTSQSYCPTSTKGTRSFCKREKQFDNDAAKGKYLLSQIFLARNKRAFHRIKDHRA